MKFIYLFKDYHNYIKILFWILVVIHFTVLYFLGIAWFGTTLLFYGLIYLVGLLFIKLFKSKKWQKLLKRNWQVLIGLLLVIEFVIYIGVMIIPNRGIRRVFYFSEQKRAEQLRFIRLIKHDKPYLDTHYFAYEKNSSRHLRRFSYSYTHHYDRNGFRNQEPLSDKYKIVFLGDSFVEGEGAPDDSTLVALLNLKSRDKNINVYNAGISGTNPISAISLYKNILEPLQLGEKKVILAICFNDVKDIELVNESFNALTFCSLLIQIILLNTQYDKKYLDLLKVNVSDFRTYLSERNIELLLAYIPARNELLDGKIQFPYSELGNIDFDLYNYFYNIKRTKYTPREWENYILNIYQYRDGHFNSNGYNEVVIHINEILNK